MEPCIIATYSFPHEAHIARANLESAGIPAYVSDAHTISANWFYSDSMGGVKLWVHPQDTQEAIQILTLDYSQMLEEQLASHLQPELTFSQNSNTSSTQPRVYTHKRRAGFALLLLLALLLY